MLTISVYVSCPHKQCALRRPPCNNIMAVLEHRINWRAKKKVGKELRLSWEYYTN